MIFKKKKKKKKEIEENKKSQIQDQQQEGIEQNTTLEFTDMVVGEFIIKIGKEVRLVGQENMMYNENIVMTIDTILFGELILEIIFFILTIIVFSLVYYCWQWAQMSCGVQVNG